MGQSASYSQQANDDELSISDANNGLYSEQPQHPEQIDLGSPVNSDVENDRMTDVPSTETGGEDQEESFVPRVDSDWRERGIMSLVVGTRLRAPLLMAPQQVESHAGSERRGAADEMSVSSEANAPQRLDETTEDSYGADWDGPHVLHSLMARETTGKPCFRRGPSHANHFRAMGGSALFSALDRPAAGIATQVVLLANAIGTGNWADTHVIVARLNSRLVTTATDHNSGSPPRRDPHTPPQAPKFYAGGGRIGLERDAFCVAGGVRTLMSIFRERAFVGSGLATSGDARDLSAVTVTLRLAQCWNHTLMILRELLYFTPQLVSRDTCWVEFLPFLFTLMAHKSCFEGAAAMIEEILSSMAQQPDRASTFCLAGIPNLSSLWHGFSPHQLAHFCRVLALLIFEPEDRALLETSTVIKSLDLLKLRRSRSARRDPTVDMNQAILLADEVLMSRLVKLLKIMNYAPPLRRFAPYHVLARYPFIVDTLVMLGLSELSSWDEFEMQDALATALQLQGAVADMLETLHETLGQPNTQMSHILHVISAAQRTGVISGRQRRDENVSENDSDEDSAVATFTGLLTDHMLASRFYRSTLDPDRAQSASISNDPTGAANSLQFNAMLLGPFQVECLFVLCTLLGGRRKMDAQDMLMGLGLVPVLEEMFERLPFSNADDSFEGDAISDQPNGIHGPNCDCTPESALCIQFLRLLHNFCDRDCERYQGRQLMLSSSEHVFVAGVGSRDATTAGLLTKIINAFMRETDESPYRFWLSSCIESFLRGSSQREQLFVARSGLLDFLLQSVCSDRLFCAGSLQTLFDVLGEVGKGNPLVVQELVSGLDEARFCKLMRAATEHLVDSNVFLRSVLLSLERHRISQNMLASNIVVQEPSAAYLTHSWVDVAPSFLPDDMANEVDQSCAAHEWFPVTDCPKHKNDFQKQLQPSESFGWVFSPLEADLEMQPYPPNSIERLNSVLAFNRARLLKGLLKVINLDNINHENICCANTAVIIAILAHRRSQLSALLVELRRLGRDEQDSRRHANTLKTSGESDDSSHHLPATQQHVHGCKAGDDEFDVLVNFRQILWFWLEYYSHRGRDRLSLEFSSHIRFHEWETVVRLLVADDGSSTSLLESRIRLPRSPYRRTASVTADFNRRGI